MPRRLTAATLVAIVGAAMALAGCGETEKDSSKNFKGDQQQVAKVIEQLEVASRKRGDPDGKQICTKLITDQLARTIAAQQRNANCDQRVKESLKDIRSGGGISTLKVLKVRVDDDKASASVEAENGDDKETSNYTLVKSGNSWRISAF